MVWPRSEAELVELQLDLAARRPPPWRPPAGPPPRPERGATRPLILERREVARWLRTRAGARPVVVHPGWRTDLDTAVAIVARATRRARTPEPLRRARTAAREARARRQTERQARAPRR